MKRWIAAAALVAGLATAGTAAANDYYVVSVEDGEVVLIDLGTEARDGNSVEIVSTWIYRNPADGVDYEVEKLELDCRGERMRILEHVGYDRSGKLLDTDGRSRWLKLPPNTVGLDLLKAACNVDQRNPKQMVDAELPVVIERFLDSPPAAAAPNT